MPDTPANEHPDSFHQADLDEAVGRLVAVIRRVRPQVILTYGDDQRGYPHPDHLRVHDISVLAFERAGDPDWYPELGRAVPAVEAVLLGVVRGRMLAMHEALLARDGKSPFDEKWFERPDMDHRITTRVDVGDFQCARSEALRAHATQVDPTESWWFGLADDELAEVYPWEDWILARSLVGPIPDRRLGARPLRRRPRARGERAAGVSTVQYRIIVGKKDERVEGPDDADVVITVPLADVTADGFDPAVAYMQGKLKSTGSDRARCSGCCASGEAARRSARLASRP